ncbi:MAG: TGS domain-containing protein [Pseudomonadota bacterium]|nr:TGS domain-containing protein [Pseudomonadota bacterium]
MPANLSPEYKAAEAAFRKSRDSRERLEWLREMLRAIPKHKGTERLQADIKARIKDLTEELEGGRKGGGHGGPPLAIHPEGAAQIALIGPPNAGKSSLHARLTGSGAPVAPYPFTTQYPEPGMMPHEDVQFQLIDLPAIAPEHPVPWLAGALQTADAGLLVVDLGEPSCLEALEGVRSVLETKRLTLIERWEATEAPRVSLAQSDEDPFALRLPTLMLANKADRIPDLDAELEALRELTSLHYPVLCVSATTGRGLGELGPWLFRNLGIVRVYTKTPGRHPEKNRPFTLRRGQTVGDVARLVHKDLERALRYARIWGHSGFEGQQVGHDHCVADGDIVELHA